MPTAHGAALGPAAGLRALGRGGRVVRQLGGNANMHWLVEGVSAEAIPADPGDVTGPGEQGRRGGQEDSTRAVLRRYGPWRGAAEVAYELQVLDRLAARGWPVPRALAAPAPAGHHLWCLFSYARGIPLRPRAPAARREDQRRRGRLLALLHGDLAALSNLGQRPGWLRRDEVLTGRPDGPTVDSVIAARVVPEHAAILLDYAAQAKARFAAVQAERLPVMIIHGDLIGDNVLYTHRRLSGIIDFDFTHLDHRAADFVWTWRGHHDDFVRGYEEVTPLTPADRALLAPCFWASVLDSVRLELLWTGASDLVRLPGAVEYLQRRSDLTGE